MTVAGLVGELRIGRGSVWKQRVAWGEKPQRGLALVPVLELVYVPVGLAVPAEKALAPLEQHLQHGKQGQEQSQWEVRVYNTSKISKQKSNKDNETYESTSRSSPPRLRLPNCMPILSREAPKLPPGITTASSALNLCRWAAERGRVCAAGVAGL